MKKFSALFLTAMLTLSACNSAPVADDQMTDDSATQDQTTDDTAMQEGPEAPAMTLAELAYGAASVELGDAIALDAAGLNMSCPSNWECSADETTGQYSMYLKKDDGYTALRGSVSEVYFSPTDMDTAVKNVGDFHDTSDLLDEGEGDVYKSFVYYNPDSIPANYEMVYVVQAGEKFYNCSLETVFDTTPLADFEMGAQEGAAICMSLMAQ